MCLCTFVGTGPCHIHACAHTCTRVCYACLRCRKLQIVERAAAKWINRIMGAAWYSWLEMHRSIQRKRNIIIRAAAKWINRRLGAAWYTWLELHAEVWTWV